MLGFADREVTQALCYSMRKNGARFLLGEKASDPAPQTIFVSDSGRKNGVLYVSCGLSRCHRAAFRAFRFSLVLWSLPEQPWPASRARSRRMRAHSKHPTFFARPGGCSYFPYLSLSLCLSLSLSLPLSLSLSLSVCPSLYVSQVKSVEKRADGKVVAHLLSGKRVCGDALLYAMGRLGNTDSLNLQVSPPGFHSLRVVVASPSLPPPSLPLSLPTIRLTRFYRPEVMLTRIAWVFLSTRPPPSLLREGTNALAVHELAVRRLCEGVLTPHAGRPRRCLVTNRTLGSGPG